MVSRLVDGYGHRGRAHSHRRLWAETDEEHVFFPSDVQSLKRCAWESLLETVLQEEIAVASVVAALEGLLWLLFDCEARAVLIIETASTPRTVFEAAVAAILASMPQNVQKKRDGVR